MVRKRPRSFCSECSWHITSKRAYSAEWSVYATTHEQCGNLSEKELTEISSGYTPPQSSQDAEPLSNYPGLISERQLITTFSLTKSQKRGISCQTFYTAQDKLSLSPKVHHSGMHTETHRSTLRQNAYSQSNNASAHVTPQGTHRSFLGVTARYQHRLNHRNKPDRYITTPNLLTKSNPAT